MIPSNSSEIQAARRSVRRFHQSFWNPESASAAGEESDDEILKTISGSSSLDEGGGSSGPGHNAFCVSNLLWLLAAVVVAHYSNFFDVAVVSALQGTIHLNYTFYIMGFSLLSLNLLIFYYLVVHLSWSRGVKSDDWDDYVPSAVPVATASFVGGVACLCIGLWPVWGLLTLPIFSIIFMGFVVGLSMVSQIYKWYLMYLSGKRVKKDS